MGISITNTIYLGKATPSSAGGSHNLGWYATPEALQTAHPTGNNGDWAQVGTTDTVWIWDSDTSAWVDSGNTDSANKNLSNLTSVGANISNWSHNVSNCGAEISQSVILTLSAGTATVKAGTKVYIPNGLESDGTTPKFDIVNIASDINVATGTITGQAYMMYMSSPSVAVFSNTLASTVRSGSSVPANYNGLFYDTTANTIDFYDSGVGRGQQFGLPLGILTASSGTVTSIDQIFDGFGCIGRQVFALPGVKAACVNGRNADGTLRNTVVTLSSVKVTSGYTCPFLIDANGNFFPAFSATYAEQETQPSFQNGYWYNPITNRINIIQNGVATQTTGAAVVMNCKLLNTNFVEYVKPVLPFRAVDYSNTNFIANQAMPSGRYTDVTLPASGSTVTAPADGFYTLAKKAGASGEYMYMINQTNNITSGMIAPNALYGRIFIPVSKGDVININYSYSGDTAFFCFVYTNGAK